MPSDIFLHAMVRDADKNSSTRFVHNVRLVDCSDAPPAVSLGVVERVASNALRSIPGDQFDGLDDAVDHLYRALTWSNTSGGYANLVLNARVLALRVLPNENSVDVFVRGLEALDRHARTDVREEVEGPAEGQVQGNVTLANCEGDEDRPIRAIVTETNWE